MNPAVRKNQYVPAAELFLTVTTYYQSDAAVVDGQRYWIRPWKAGMDSLSLKTKHTTGGFPLNDPADWVRRQLHQTMLRKEWQRCFELAPPDNKGQNMQGTWMLGKADGTNNPKGIVALVYNQETDNPDIISFFNQHFTAVKKSRKDEESTTKRPRQAEFKVFLLFIQDNEEPILPPPELSHIKTAIPPKKSGRAAGQRKNKATKEEKPVVRQNDADDITYPPLSEHQDDAEVFAQALEEAADLEHLHNSMNSSIIGVPETTQARTIKEEDSSGIWESTTIWRPEEAAAEGLAFTEVGHDPNDLATTPAPETNRPQTMKELMERFRSGWQPKVKKEPVEVKNEKSEPESVVLDSDSDLATDASLPSIQRLIRREGASTNVRHSPEHIKPTLPLLPFVEKTNQHPNPSDDNPNIAIKPEPKTPPRPKRKVAAAALSPLKDVRQTDIVHGTQQVLQPVYTGRNLRKRPHQY